MIQVWEGETPKPIGDADWVPWLEVIIQIVMACNAFLTKEGNCLKGAQVRAHSKKIQSTKVQLQLDPTNERT
jgi:hypothetical protein